MIENRAGGPDISRRIRFRASSSTARKERKVLVLLPPVVDNVIFLPVRKERALQETTKEAGPLSSLLYPYYREQLAKAVESGAINSLSVDQKRVLRKRFLSKDGAVPTQREVASRMRIKVPKVSTLERKGLTNLGIVTKRQEFYRSLVVEGKEAGVLENLTPEVREVLTRKYLGEHVLSNRQIAGELGNSWETIEDHADSGLMKIGERLGKYGLSEQKSKQERNQEKRAEIRRDVVKKGFESGLFDILSETEEKVLEMRGYLSPKVTLNDNYEKIAKEIGISVKTLINVESIAIKKLALIQGRTDIVYKVRRVKKSISQEEVMEMVSAGFDIGKIAIGYDTSERVIRYVINRYWENSGLLGKKVK